MTSRQEQVLALTELLKTHFRPRIMEILNQMRYNIGDKILASVVSWGMMAQEEEGVVIGLDRQRQQYHVKLVSGKELWLNQDEIQDLPAHRRGYTPVPIHTSDTSMACKHEYVLYIGLMEQFNHCKKCGTKEHPDV